MRKTKNTDMKPMPKKTNDVKHGCCSCQYKETDIKKFPCSECESGKTWLYWTDKDAKQTEEGNNNGK